MTENEPEVKTVTFELTEKQQQAWSYLVNSQDVELVYGGARGGGKSHMMCIWVYYWTNWLIDFYGLEPGENPVPLGFFGRKQGSDFQKTTLETWKKLIPAQNYEIRKQDHEIIIRGAGKVYFGGLDSREAVSKFTSAELAFRAIDQAEETEASDVGDLGGALRLVINGKRPPYKSLYTANPAESWLKSEFIPPWGPAPRVTDDQPFKVFVPALPTDNPHLPSGYISRLKDSYKYEPALQRAMIEGDWNVLSGFKKLVSLSDLTACFLPGNEQLSYDENWVISLDSARFGDDKSVLLVGRSRNLVDREIWGKRDTSHAYGRIRYWDDYTGNQALIVIDLGGQVGAGVYDDLVKIMPTRVLGINFGGGAIDDLKYFRKRSEMFGNLRESILAQKLGLPRDYIELHKQLCAIEYDYRNDLQFYIKPKEKMKHDLKILLDDSDAMAMLEEGFRHIEGNRDLLDKNSVKVYPLDNNIDEPSWVAANNTAEFNEQLPEMGMYS